MLTGSGSVQFMRQFLDSDVLCVNSPDGADIHQPHAIV